jgi:hypothetical protein
MSPYPYSPLVGPRSIRLVCLLPSRNEVDPIHCDLVHYSLSENSGTSHLYEALSYVWGDTDETEAIIVHGHSFNVTQNLHAALRHLRNRSFQRILWIDAICINQKDDNEKEIQIRFMAEIYGQADRVIIWLGVCKDNSDKALEDICEAAERDDTDPITPPTNQARVIALLQRPWFQRIWVN